MQINTSVTSCTSFFIDTSGITESQEQVDPSIVADLETSQRCDMQIMLRYLLKLCTNPVSHSNPALQPSTLQTPSPDNYSGGFPLSMDTMQYSAGLTQECGSLYRKSKSNPVDTPSQPDLFQICLQAALPYCKDNQLLKILDDLKSSQEDKSCDVPMARLFNYALLLLSAVEIPGIRAPSDLEILFAVSNSERVHWRPGYERSPELVILSLGAARRLYKMPNADWNSLSEACLVPPQKIKVEWPDVLASVEVSTCLEHPIVHLSEDDDSAEATSNSSIQLSKLVQSPELIQVSRSLTTAGSIRSSHSGRSSANVSSQAADSKLWLWWYHPQGAIQTTAIDFIQNLPHLLVLLFALQRFTLADWGLNLELDPSIELRQIPQPPETGNSTSNLPQGPTDHPLPSSESTNRSQRTLASGHQHRAFGDGQQGKEMSTNGKQENSSDKTSSETEARIPWIQPMSASVTVNKKLSIRHDVPMLAPLHAPFCLHGRSTKSFAITDTSDANASDDSPKHHMAKLYWPYMRRSKEEDLIREARGVADDLGNHLPRVIGFRDINPTSTLRIRKELDFNQVPSSARALRMIIFERLIPIVHLQGNKFLTALVECMRCHYVLWHNGIRHQDISLGNLMVQTVGDRYYGVLNDWDLSFSDGKSEFEADLTATVPYVAIRLLYLWRVDPKADRKYYFELESFFWCMIWTFLAVKDRKLRPTPAMVDWLTGDIRRNADLRGSYFRHPEQFHAYEAWRSYEDMRFEISEWIRCRLNDLESKIDLDGDLELLRGFLEIVSQNVAGLEMPTSPAINGL
ncbi:Translocation and assembly module TamB [Rhizoctonia solani]|uniref:Translocation and assembly module TamB n=1 Tax=Rhizoctonia solani TaxID=456999 RepID=A0A0K6G3Y9_9AGAM|nr:Translocation and assembly module TamB [Rhizoctonia solani]